MSTKPGTGGYFSKVIHQDPPDLSSPLVAAATRTNPFNFAAWLAGKAGVNVEP